jgi:hypothetical protein
MELERHEMVVAARKGMESLFECTVEACRRQMILDHHDGRMTVVVVGDPEALHYGSSGLVSLVASVDVRQSLN